MDVSLTLYYILDFHNFLHQKLKLSNPRDVLKIKEKNRHLSSENATLIFQFFFSIFNSIFPFTCCHLKLTQSPERYFPRLEAKLKINSKIEIKNGSSSLQKKLDKKTTKRASFWRYNLRTNWRKLFCDSAGPNPPARARSLAPNHLTYDLESGKKLASTLFELLYIFVF